MSLDVYLTDMQPTQVFEANITHNLSDMARDAGVYEYLWEPEALGVTRAEQLIEPLRKGLALMKSDPVRFKKFNAENGWGTYNQFVPWVRKYLAACVAHPNALISVSR